LIKNFIFYLFSGGLPAGLRFGPTGLASPATAPGLTNPASTSSTPSTSTGQAPSSTTGTGIVPPSADPSNYAGVFAQMLNMMSNQNIVN
jgi:hypothetical protein